MTIRIHANMKYTIFDIKIHICFNGQVNQNISQLTHPGFKSNATIQVNTHTIIQAHAKRAFNQSINIDVHETTTDCSAANPTSQKIKRDTIIKNVYEKIFL